MNEMILKIIPIIFIFVLGYFLNLIKVLNKDNAELLLKLVFYVAAPSLILVSMTKVKLDFGFIWLPVIAALVFFSVFIVSYVVGGKILVLKKRQLGAFLVGTMIMNIGFTYPFLLAGYGLDGFARMQMFDFVNCLLCFTFAYYIACRHGSNKGDSISILKRFVFAPPIWALMIAIVLNFAGVQLPEVADGIFQTLGNMLIPLILLSLGIYFTPKIVRFVPLACALAVRMLFGLLLGFFFAWLFRLEGLSRIVVIIGASAPIAYNTLTFASFENLDKEFSASMISISILVGIILVPMLMFFL